MNIYNKIFSSLLFLLITFAILNCSTDKKDDETNLILVLAALTSNTNAGFSLDPNTNCIVGQNSSMSSSMPDWVKNNFKCSVGTVSGSNLIFTSLNLPNTKSHYYGSTSSLYEALPSGNSEINNKTITSQNFTFTIPITPAVNGGIKTSTNLNLPSGITVNGLAIFNNQESDGSSLSAKTNTFDNFNGHINGDGLYHHHINPINISSNTQNSNLIGIALDGYPIYGLLCDQATTDTADDAAPGTGTPALDIRHGHTANTVLFPGGSYHYHLAFDGTATMNTLLGSAFHGIVGSITNE